MRNLQTDHVRLQTLFDTMTDEQHDAMKVRLLGIAKDAKDKPRADTIEGFCLRNYCVFRRCEWTIPTRCE